MPRSLAHSTCFFLGCCILIGNVVDEVEATERPNVVVFLVDDMGIMDTSVPFLTDEDGVPKRYALNNFYQTPNMQRLAERGIRFNNFYAMSVCSPTRVSLLTGQNAARHHTTQWISPEQNNRGANGPPDWNWLGLNQRSTTLPRLLRESGYRTIHVGKGHFGPFGSEGADPRNLGFDVNIGGRAIGAPGSYSGQDNYENLSRNKDRSVPHLNEYHGTETHLTDALTKEALKEVTASVRQGTPFFLYLAHYAVHSPHQSDPRFAHRYATSKRPERAKNFATLIEGMDQSLGDVLDRLHKLGVDENTFVFFLGDNGSDAPLGHQHAVACAAPLRGKKGSHYEGGTRVPLIAAWASPKKEHPLQQEFAVAKSAIQPQIASVCDLLPTICELATVKMPHDAVVDGTSMIRLLRGESDSERSLSFLMHFPHEHRSSYYSTLRMGDWKVAYQYLKLEDADGDRYQLFDLSRDPFEQNNLAKSHPEKLHKMMRELRDQLENHSAQLPVASLDDPQPMLPRLPNDAPDLP